jgi:hypothetical protein
MESPAVVLSTDEDESKALGVEEDVGVEEEGFTMVND